MTAERLSDVPKFTLRGVVWRCWIVPDGLNELGLSGERFVWRSVCGRYAAGRLGYRRVGDGTLQALHWARRNGRVVGAEFPTNRAAMAAAQDTRRIAA